MCDAKKNLNMINTNPKDSTIIHLTLENFRVQAFEFKNATSGDYGKGVLSLAMLCACVSFNDPTPFFLPMQLTAVPVTRITQRLFP